MRRTLIFCMSLLTITFFFIAAVGVYAETNENLCKQWCSQHSDICKKCSPQVGCGVGYQSVATFKIDPAVWHACKGDETNKEACEAWCKEHKPQCEKCDDKIECGTGYRTMMRFTGGGGKGFFACEKTALKAASEDNKALCENYCNANKPQCAKCSKLAGCGPGYEMIQSFGGHGIPWFACKKRK